MLRVTKAENLYAKNMLQYIEQFCEERGLDKNIVDDVIRTYYTFVKQALNNPEKSRVRVNGLGFFEISINKSIRARRKASYRSEFKKKYVHTSEFYKEQADRIEKLVQLSIAARKDYRKFRYEHKKNIKK